MIKDFADEFGRYKAIGRKAFDQVPDDQLNQVLGPDNNSIAILVRHISGNLISRFTDFLTSDGEKPWRDRDREFEEVRLSRQQTHETWEKGWKVLEDQLSTLDTSDLDREVSIRGQQLTVNQALCRSLAHIAYHVGQIVLLARIVNGGRWDWITIPRGKSREYNLNPTKEKKPQ